MSLKRSLQSHLKLGLVNTHAIGDRANRVVLDTYQKVYANTGGKLLAACGARTNC